jgi:uncharacterized protein
VVPSLRVRVRDLQRHQGSHEDLEAELDLSGLRVGEVEVGTDPVRISVSLESLRGGVRVDGTATTAWIGECRRCLGEATGTSESRIEELFADAPGSLEDFDSEEAQPVEDGFIDLGPSVRDTVALSLPLAPLCRPDCPGPSPEDFPVSVEGATASVEEPDPRWAALAELRFDPGTE